MKILESKTLFNKMYYKVELEGEEKFWTDNKIALMVEDWIGFGYKVTRFENIAEVTVYTD